MSAPRLAVAFALSLLASAPAAATVTVRVVSPVSEVSVGETFTIELRAEASQPILGFGLDLGFDGAVLAIDAPPAIGPLWDPLVAPDGDGLAGLVFPAGLTGDLLLATLSFEALAPGITSILASFTAGDLTEGFPLDPSGRDEDVSFTGAPIQVVPEPASGLLVAAGLLGLAASRFGGRLSPL
jgi:hypothetical protein